MPKSKSKIQSVLLPPPVVTILGHVDHGKTTLLDLIRKTKVAQNEIGGITQHIGAYQIQVSPKGELSSRATPTSRRGSRGIPSEHKEEILRQAQDDSVSLGHKITFIDTPGHEAFAKMRERGAMAADVAILVVAANDGVQPQTIESIKHIQSAKIPVIVALNKIDLPGINVEKIKKQLTREGLSLEEYGGETPLVSISAKTGQGLDKLLSTITLIYELYRKKPPTANFEAVVIESQLSKYKGPIATVIVRNGDLTAGEEIISEGQKFKVRALISFLGQNIPKATNGDPVEILGWKILPAIGSRIYKKNESVIEIAPPVALSKQVINNQTVISTENAADDKIKLIFKADTAGSLEALTEVLSSKVNVILSGVGNISESDILLAKTAKAIIVGYNVEPSQNVAKLANSEKVLIKTYHLIYKLFEELDEVIEAIKKGNLVTILGEAKIIEIFSYKEDKIAGVKVVSGRIARGDQIKLVRGEEEIGRAKIKSLRHAKEDISKAEQGKEGGVILSQKLDFLTGDSIIAIG